MIFFRNHNARFGKYFLINHYVFFTINKAQVVKSKIIEKESFAHEDNQNPKDPKTERKT
jgi:hypothetical protein